MNQTEEDYILDASEPREIKREATRLVYVILVEAVIFSALFAAWELGDLASPEDTFTFLLLIAYSVFITMFIASFIGAVIGLPLSSIPIRGYTFEQRFFRASLFVVIILYGLGIIGLLINHFIPIFD